MEKYTIGIVTLSFLACGFFFTLGAIYGWKAAHRSMLEWMNQCQKSDINGFKMRCESKQ